MLRTAPHVQAIRELAADTLFCLRFYSRLPVPLLPFESPASGMGAFRRAVRMLPIAGVLIGAVAAAVLVMGHALGLPDAVVAVAVVAAQFRLTGGLHEDGLADTLDGLGGGGDRERKLAIMKDSRIGTYGAAGLMLGLMMRTAAVAGLLTGAGGTARAAAALVAAAAVSRVAGLLPLMALPPARASGLGRAAGRPSTTNFAVAAGLACAIALVSGRKGILGCAFAAGAAAYVVHLGHRHLGGQTGDLAGAAQQSAEIAFLVALLIDPPLG
jgi:adenosylcobinamide-GDP ribazoletransferase